MNLSAEEIADSFPEMCSVIYITSLIIESNGIPRR
jgi:hypothetical protein